MTARLSPARIGIYAFLLSAALFFLLPLYVMVITSFKPMAEIRMGNVFALPGVATLDPWHAAWGAVSQGFWNSVAIAVPSTVIPILLGAINGYALSFWRPRGANLLFGVLLAGLRGIDPEIYKAARLDGIPAWRVYLQIVLPMLGPTVATVFLLLSTAVVKLFDAVVAMTQGGPGIASEVPAKFIMDHLFLRSNIGLASAGAVTLLVPVLALLAPYAYARSRRARLSGGHA